ncbi:MAG: branched-chain amino acid ABC transporter permease [Caldisericota bacterium]|nr:branched-chain amino acid ABC transporter permease [Caldisericota bacterium]
MTPSRLRRLMVNSSIAALVLLLPLVFRTRPSIIGYLNIAMLYAIATQGLNLLMGFGGLVSLGHAAFMAIGGYTAAVLVMTYNVNMFLAIVAGVATAGVFGLVIGFPSLRLSGFYLAVATMALGSSVADVIKRLEITGGDYGLINIPSLRLGGWELASEASRYYVFAGIVVVVFLAVRNFLRSRSGRAVRAVRDSEMTAAAMGVNVAAYKLVTFVFAACIAGLSGALYAFTISYLHPMNFGLVFSIELLSMSIIGGLGTIIGPILGAVFWVMLPIVIGGRMEYLSTVIFGLSIIGSVMFLPKGLSELVTRIQTRLKL